VCTGDSSAIKIREKCAYHAELSILVAVLMLMSRRLPVRLSDHYSSTLQTSQTSSQFKNQDLTPPLNAPLSLSLLHQLSFFLSASTPSSGQQPRLSEPIQVPKQSKSLIAKLYCVFNFPVFVHLFQLSQMTPFSFIVELL
jgi:hypothetical protein